MAERPPRPFEIRALTAIMLFWAIVGIVTHVILWPPKGPPTLHFSIDTGTYHINAGPLITSEKPLEPNGGSAFVTDYHFSFDWSALFSLIAAIGLWRMTGGRTLALWLGWLGLLWTASLTFRAFPELGWRQFIVFKPDDVTQVPTWFIRIVGIPFLALLVWQLVLLRSRPVLRIYKPWLFQPLPPFDRPAFARPWPWEKKPAPRAASLTDSPTQSP